MGKPNETRLHPAFIHGITVSCCLPICPAAGLCCGSSTVCPVHCSLICVAPTISSHRIHRLVRCPIRRTVCVLILAGVALLHRPVLLRWIRAIRCSLRIGVARVRVLRVRCTGWLLHSSTRWLLRIGCTRAILTACGGRLGLVRSLLATRCRGLRLVRS